MHYVGIWNNAKIAHDWKPCYCEIGQDHLDVEQLEDM